MNENIDKIIESERCLLAIILNNNEYLVKALDIVSKDDFYRSTHKILFDTMTELYKNNIKFDSVILINKLDKQIRENVIKVTEITEISTSYITDTTFFEHAKIILENSRKRKLNELCNKILKGNNPVDLDTKLIQDVLLDINSNTIKNKCLTINEIMENTLIKIEAARRTEDGITGIPTGLKSLDSAINGLERGSMIVFGARPGIGKTTFTLKILENIRAKVLYIQLDMRLEGMGQRMLAADTGISNNRIGKGRLNESQFMSVRKSANKMGNKENLFFYSPGSITISEIMLKAKEIKLKHGLDVIIIDHMSKIKPETDGTKYEQMTAVSNGVKNIARELGVCVIALCQLKRAVEEREDKHPMLFDLRDTGAIEEDADVIGLLYRNNYYIDKSRKEDILEVNIEKNRNGQTGRIEFNYNLITQKLIERL